MLFMRNLTFYLFAFLLALSVTKPATAFNFPDIDPVPGGVAVIKLFDSGQPKPVVYFLGEKVMVVDDNHLWYAVVGLPLTLEAGDHTITVIRSANDRQQVSLRVKDKTYASQYLRVKNKRHVEPDDEDVDRILQEQEEIKGLFGIWTPIDNPQLNLDAPVDGRLSSRFGLKRFFNRQPRKPHSGLDIAAPEGTDVRAPSPAIVIGTGDYFFSGKAVFLDHGQGMITMYNHLHTIAVAVGDKVERGQKIGEVGKTGRVTGAHLHWTVSLNNTRVNPELFLRQSVVGKTGGEDKTVRLKAVP